MPRSLPHRFRERLALQSYLVFPLPKGLLQSSCVLINGCLSNFPRRNCISAMSAPGGSLAVPSPRSLCWCIMNRILGAGGTHKSTHPYTHPAGLQDSGGWRCGTGQGQRVGAWLGHMAVVTTVLRERFRPARLSCPSPWPQAEGTTSRLGADSCS